MKLLLALHALLCANAFAVMLGQERPTPEVSTVEFATTHTVFSAEGYLHRPGDCSSVVIGVHPLVLLTASHCFNGADIDPATEQPKVELLHLGSIPQPTLKLAVYNKHNDYVADAAKDVAVLIFKEDADPSWKSVEIGASAGESGSVYICGFDHRPASERPRCAWKKTIPPAVDFTAILPLTYNSSDPDLYARYQAQFESHRDALASGRALAVNRLDAQGHYSFQEPMPKEGDSGGPWFASDGKVAAVSSFADTFHPDDGPLDPFLRIPGAPIPADYSLPDDFTEMPYVFFGVRLDTPEAQDVLRRAKAAGLKYKYGEY